MTKSDPHTGNRKSRIFVVVFVLTAILSAVYGSIVFKQMIDDEELQEQLDEVRRGEPR